jgi:hypothetical protein
LTGVDRFCLGFGCARRLTIATSVIRVTCRSQLLQDLPGKPAAPQPFADASGAECRKQADPTQNQDWMAAQALQGLNSPIGHGQRDSPRLHAARHDLPLMLGAGNQGGAAIGNRR